MKQIINPELLKVGDCLFSKHPREGNTFGEIKKINENILFLILYYFKDNELMNIERIEVKGGIKYSAINNYGWQDYKLNKKEIEEYKDRILLAKI